MLQKLFKQDQDSFLYVTFYESNDSFMAEHLFKKHHIEGKLISAPAFLTTGCGLAWRGPVDSKEEVEQVLKMNEINYEKLRIH